jgi:hypothetical protein
MNIIATCSRQPWNKGKLVGQKTPLRLRDIWAIRVRLQIAERARDLAHSSVCRPEKTGRHPFSLIQLTPVNIQLLKGGALATSP